MHDEAGSQRLFGRGASLLSTFGAEDTIQGNGDRSNLAKLSLPYARDQSSNIPRPFPTPGPFDHLKLPAAVGHLNSERFDFFRRCLAV